MSMYRHIGRTIGLLVAVTLVLVLGDALPSLPVGGSASQRAMTFFVIGLMLGISSVSLGDMVCLWWERTKEHNDDA